MAYNYNFPVGYQPVNYYPNSYQQNINQAQQTQTNGIIWVQGEAGAKSYLVAPNTTVHLWDSESPIIYVKSADSAGVPSIRVIDYKYRDDPKKEEKSTDNYVTWDDLKKVKKEILEQLEVKKDDE